MNIEKGEKEMKSSNSLPSPPLPSMICNFLGIFILISDFLIFNLILIFKFQMLHHWLASQERFSMATGFFFNSKIKLKKKTG
jgi:hypothetical protein